MGLTKSERHYRMMTKIFEDYKNNPNNLCVNCFELVWGRDAVKDKYGLHHAKCLELLAKVPY